MQETTNDQESFHLLQISDSASDSLPDLDLVSHNTNFKKKKVRLKRSVSPVCPPVPPPTSVLCPGEIVTRVTAAL